MKNVKKILALLLCAVLLVGASIAGTVAYLTSKDAVTNTFTVGKVAIILDETDVDDSTADADRDQANAYHLMPGNTYVKDPTVHVKNDSEPSYIFVEINNGLEGIVDATTIEDQILANGWTLLTEGGNVYYKTWSKAENATAEYEDLVVFQNFKIKNDVANEPLNGYANATISVTAYAIQQVNTTSVENAWTLVKGAYTNP